jgi:hypothetical protein
MSDTQASEKVNITCRKMNDGLRFYCKEFCCQFNIKVVTYTFPVHMFYICSHFWEWQPPCVMRVTCIHFGARNILRR